MSDDVIDFLISENAIVGYPGVFGGGTSLDVDAVGRGAAWDELTWVFHSTRS